MKNSQLLTPICAAVAIIGFFCPWMSCGMVKMSGQELASGISGGGETGKGLGDANPLLWIVPLAAIAILGLYFMYQKRNTLRSAMIPMIVASGIALGIMGVKYMDVQKMNSGVSDKLKDEKTNTVTQPTEEGDEKQTAKDSSDAKLSAGVTNMMSNMFHIEWGFWLTAIAFVGCIAGATQLKNNPPTVVDIAGAPPTLPDDGSNVNQDLGA